MEEKEAKILNDIRLALSPRAVLFRQQVGTFYTYSGNPVKIGFKGTPDLCGWRSVEVTPDMVGKRIAVYTGIEVKSRRGYLRPEQEHFIKKLGEAGGYAGCARTIEEAEKIIR